jgi:hypothetical protein
LQFLVKLPDLHAIYKEAYIATDLTRLLVPLKGKKHGQSNYRYGNKMSNTGFGREWENKIQVC